MKISPLYILPNLFTAGSIFLGILSIMAASKGLYSFACWFIVVSMLLDGLDGRVARLTNTSSKFGVEFDSLADIVAFGVAPSILLYFYVGFSFSRIGEVTSAFFVIFGAIRLARFNITTSSEPNFFIGLPIPSAAIFIVLWILVDLEHKIFLECKYLLILGAFIVSILMVSNVRYPSFKKMQWNLKSFIVLLILIGIVLIEPVEVLCALMSLYVLYGVLRWLVLRIRILLKLSS